MDESTIVGAAAIWIAKDGVGKLLGPTAEYLGNSLKNLVERRGKTVGAILENAALKLGNRVDLPGQVPPKVLKVILDEGSFAREPLAIDYLGGGGSRPLGPKPEGMIEGRASLELWTACPLIRSGRTILSTRLPICSLRTAHYALIAPATKK